MRCPEFLAGHFVHFHNPYFDILHSRIGIAEFFIRILFHNDIQSFRFFIEIFFKVDFTPANHALGAHPVATSDLRMLENEIMIRAKRNADTRIPFQNGDTPSFLCRMQVRPAGLNPRLDCPHVGELERVPDCDRIDH